MMLTQRQKEYLAFIKGYFKQYGCTPPAEKVAFEFEVATSTAQRMISGLCDRGILRRRHHHASWYEMPEDDLSFDETALASFGFCRFEIRILCQLLNHRVVSNERILELAYNDILVDERPEVGIVKVAIYHIRQKLKPYGITIENLYGIGYSIRRDNKEKLRALMA